MEDNVGVQGGEARVPIRFTGQAGEYFRIWIVNVCLSVVTLGIYSAWAKVRRKRYFYGNTLLNDAAFEYLANPRAILKGRIIVFVLIATLTVLTNLTGSWLYLIIYVLVLPYVVIKACRFNAMNSGYRNVRFQFGRGFGAPSGVYRWFGAGYRETSQFLILPVFLVPLTSGLLYPYYAYRKRQFVREHLAYGLTPFSFDARPGEFYSAYFNVALLLIVFLIGSYVTYGVGAVPLYSLFAAYRDAAVGRITWKHTQVGDLQFDCDWRMWDLFKLYLTNGLAIIFTLGFMVPWAAVRLARYRLQGLSLRPASALGGFVAATQEQMGAVGEESVELLGFDLGLDL